MQRRSGAPAHAARQRARNVSMRNEVKRSGSKYTLQSERIIAYRVHGVFFEKLVIDDSDIEANQFNGRIIHTAKLKNSNLTADSRIVVY